MSENPAFLLAVDEFGGRCVKPSGITSNCGPQARGCKWVPYSTGPTTSDKFCQQLLWSFLFNNSFQSL